MRIACIGGGPAGLYFAISMKLRDPRHEVHVFERNAEGVTFGWGVVFSDQTVENLMANDPVSGQVIADEFAHWDDIDVHIHDACVRSSGHGFIGIGRKRLLEILAGRACELGVEIHYEHECDPDLSTWAGWDLIIAADGINSRFREAYADRFGVDVQERARELGVALHFEHEASPDLAAWADYDLVIAADGANSLSQVAMLSPWSISSKPMPRQVSSEHSTMKVEQSGAKR